jgi:predicted nuclease of predicted toxin-antitoxin system
MIRLLADENVEGRVIRLLRAEGYDVASIQETQSGVADEMVLETAVSSATVLLTGDSDFGKLHFQRGHIHSGILFYRLPRTTTEEKAQIILKTLRDYSDKLINSFTVITLNKVRIRRL